MFYAVRIAESLMALYPQQLHRSQPFAILVNLSNGKMTRVELTETTPRAC